MTHRVVNFIGFQLAWFACILGAARGAPWFGPIIVALLVAVHLVFRRHRLSGEIVLLALAGVLGYVMDSVLVTSGLLAFPESARLGGPSALWMVALWVNLAATLHVSMGWLARRYVFAAVFGAVGGPLSYWAGARLGAVALEPNLAASLGAIAIEWIIAMPLLIWLAGRTDGSVGLAPYRLARVVEAGP